MQITITTGQYSAPAPSSVGVNTITVDNSAEHQYSLDDFTTNTTPAYGHPNNADVSYLVATSTPNLGSLWLNGSIIENYPAVIQAIDISSGNLVHKTNVSQGAPTSGTSDVSSKTGFWKFDLADVESLQVSSPGNPPGLMTIIAEAYINLPPSFVGSNTIPINNENYYFTEANFTNETTPPYTDPEGDAAYQLKVTSLPSSGELKVYGHTVSLNGIISFSNIRDGYFYYVPDGTASVAYSVNFNFEISDEGSKTFTA